MQNRSEELHLAPIELRHLQNTIQTLRDELEAQIRALRDDGTDKDSPRRGKAAPSEKRP